MFSFTERDATMKKLRFPFLFFLNETKIKTTEMCHSERKPTGSNQLEEFPSLLTINVLKLSCLEFSPVKMNFEFALKEFLSIIFSLFIFNLFNFLFVIPLCLKATSVFKHSCCLLKQLCKMKMEGLGSSGILSFKMSSEFTKILWSIISSTTLGTTPNHISFGSYYSYTMLIILNDMQSEFARFVI